MKDLSHLGVKPSSTCERYQKNVETMFLLASFVAGVGVLVCVYDEFVRREPYNKMISLVFAWPLVALQVTRLSFSLWTELDPHRQLMPMGMCGWIKYHLISSPSMVYVATVFGAAWFHDSWLHRPFLVAATMCIVGVFYSLAKTAYAANQGGGIGIDLDEYGRER